jgi:DNA primase
MPLAWRDVTPRLSPDRFDIRSAPRRLSRSGDPMRAVLGLGIDAVALLDGLAQRLEAPAARPPRG